MRQDAELCRGLGVLLQQGGTQHHPHLAPSTPGPPVFSVELAVNQAGSEGCFPACCLPVQGAKYSLSN